MEIISDWAEEQKEEFPSSGLSLFLAEDDEAIEEMKAAEKEIEAEQSEQSEPEMEQTEKKTPIINKTEQKQQKATQIEQKSQEITAKTVETEQKIEQKQQKATEIVPMIEQGTEQKTTEYLFPPMDLLSKNKAVQSSQSKSEMLVNAKKLETTLKVLVLMQRSYKSIKDQPSQDTNFPQSRCKG